MKLKVYLVPMALTALAVHAQAAVMVVNNDGVDYEFEAKCQAETTNEWVDPRGMIELQSGPCELVFKNGQKLMVPDNETAAISKGKVELQ